MKANKESTREIKRAKSVGKKEYQKEREIQDRKRSRKSEKYRIEKEAGRARSIGQKRKQKEREVNRRKNEEKDKLI